MKYFLSFIFLISFSTAIDAKAEVIESRTIRAEKIGSSDTIRVHSYGVTRIEIIGVENKSRISRVNLQTRRGIDTLYRLEGSVREGQIASIRVDPRKYVEHIHIESHSSLIGSRGEFKVRVHINDRYERRPPRHPRRPPPRRPAPPRDRYDYGPYPIEVEERIYDLIYDFANDSFGGLGLIFTEARVVADRWVQEGRRCGDERLVRDMVREYERAYNSYRRRMFFVEARKRALERIRPISYCTRYLHL